MVQRRTLAMRWLQPEWDCRFVIGSDVGLRLYRMTSAQGGDNGARFEMADFRSIRHAVTSLASYPRPLEQSSIIAVGNLAGEVGLQFYAARGAEGLGMDYASSGVSIYEASGRICRDMEFSSVNNDLLACGFDHKEGRPSLHIHDLASNMDIRQLLGTRSTPWSTHSESVDNMSDITHRTQKLQIQPQRTHSRAPSAASSALATSTRDAEYGPSYSGSGVTSLCWIPGSADDLLVASKKTRSSIRWYDLRARSSGETVLYVPMSDPDSTDAVTPGTVYDLQFDPFNNMRYMAHDRRGLVNMWDIRWATTPVHTFNTGQKNVLNMQFSPRHSGMVASLEADSNVFEIVSINELLNGRIMQNQRLDARAFLDDARMKDHYDDDHMALLSTPPPRGIRVWTHQASTVPPPASASEPHTAFMWVPAVVSNATRAREQLISSTASGTLHVTRLPQPYVSTINCRGDMAMSNNWSRLQNALPASKLEMDILHGAISEIHEVVLDKSSRQSHSTQASTAGLKSGLARTAAASAGVSTTPSLSSVQQANQPQNGSGLLARRHQAARQNPSEGDTRAAQLRERLRTMNLGLSSSTQTMASTDAGLKMLPADLRERLAAGAVTFDPETGDRYASDTAVEAALAGDILVQMRQRALQGYGTNADKNAHMFQHNMQMYDMWQWIRDASIRRSSGAHFVEFGVDASFYGVYEIMKLRHKQLKYIYKLQPLEAHQRKMAASLPRSRLDGQRLLALRYCGWGLSGYIREQHVHALESAGKFSVAAGTSFVYGDYQRCLQSLEKSSAQDQKLLSFMLRAQLDADNRLAPALAGSGGTLAPGDMFKCPHLQMIFMYLATGDWERVLDNMERLPLSYRVAVALRYLDDSSLMRRLLRMGRQAVRHGEIDGLLITGISGGGRLVMQAYVDSTADVQTAALVSIFDPSNDVEAAETAEKWIYGYRHLLNMWRMFTTRCLFDIAHGNSRESKGLARVSEVAQKIAVQPADVRCTFCHQSLDTEASKRTGRLAGGSSAGLRTDGSTVSTPGAGVPMGVAAAPGIVGPGIGGVHGGNKNSGSDARLLHMTTAQPLLGQKGAGGDARRKDMQQAQTRLLYTHCPRCNNDLPRCVVCRMKLGTLVPQSNEAGAAISGDFAQWFSWCQTCGHGGHVSHMQGWFATHAECPVPACSCECDLRD
ncbi:hypothetical protein IWW36_000236 [Coemansia brasiliensis]|uniref:WD repeat protein mio zinc-ribbon like domain-containing protein n=1 Tax=Coemansia brasiliensis TaxID=2650707 RepID=A0A9W8M383_9FUNG|nr:hypothetical protein IWW36_000236 [Coemansia brasiliensis]